MEMPLIREGLSIGTRNDASNLVSVKLPNDTLRILTVDSEPLKIEKDGVSIRHITCLDEPEADLLSFFDECSDFITAGLQNKQNVIVHWLVRFSVVDLFTDLHRKHTVILYIHADRETLKLLLKIRKRGILGILEYIKKITFFHFSYNEYQLT